MGFLHSATCAAPAMRPRAAGPLVAGGLLVLMVAAAGCRLDARGVLHELDRIDEDYRSGKIMRLLSSLGDQSRLAERVGRETEDVITEAYFAAPSDERRRDLLGVVSEVGTSSGRFIPLLLYVMQCESSYDLRSAAASCLVEVERLDPAVCAGCVALAMADVAEDAPLPHRREWAVLYLERFLTRGCGVELPGRPVTGGGRASPARGGVALVAGDRPGTGGAGRVAAARRDGRMNGTTSRRQEA